VDDRFQWIDVSGTHLPPVTLETDCLNSAFIDVDGDDDLDVFLATEFQPNVLLINDGSGTLADESNERLPRAAHDSEDVAAGDFDRDGDPDLIVVSEDDFVKEHYVNDGHGFFTSEDSFPAEQRSNAIALGDVDDDGTIDLILGNDGQNALFLGDGAGGFSDATANRLPADVDVTQDVELGDLDGDGDLDLVVGNEDGNRSYSNLGGGFFEAGPVPLPPAIEETRGVALADIDGDGDLDGFFGNVALTTAANPQNRLLINDGRGALTDETEDRLPTDDDFTMDGDFADLDGDGDLDLATANYGDLERGRALSPYRAYLNEAGRFTDRTAELFPPGVTGHGFDLEIGDLNGDAIPDLYLCSGRSLDRLLLSSRRR